MTNDNRQNQDEYDAIQAKEEFDSMLHSRTIQLEAQIVELEAKVVELEEANDDE